MDADTQWLEIFQGYPLSLLCLFNIEAAQWKVTVAAVEDGHELLAHIYERQFETVFLFTKFQQ